MIHGIIVLEPLQQVLRAFREPQILLNIAMKLLQLAFMVLRVCGACARAAGAPSGGRACVKLHGLSLRRRTAQRARRRPCATLAYRLPGLQRSSRGSASAKSSRQNVVAVLAGSFHARARVAVNGNNFWSAKLSQLGLKLFSGNILVCAGFCGQALAQGLRFAASLGLGRADWRVGGPLRRGCACALAGKCVRSFPMALKTHRVLGVSLGVSSSWMPHIQPNSGRIWSNSVRIWPSPGQIWTVAGEFCPQIQKNSAHLRPNRLTPIPS